MTGRNGKLAKKADYNEVLLKQSFDDSPCCTFCINGNWRATRVGHWRHPGKVNVNTRGHWAALHQRFSTVWGVCKLHVSSDNPHITYVRNQGGIRNDSGSSVRRFWPHDVTTISAYFSDAATSRLGCAAYLSQTARPCFPLQLVRWSPVSPSLARIPDSPPLAPTSSLFLRREELCRQRHQQIHPTRHQTADTCAA